MLVVERQIDREGDSLPASDMRPLRARLALPATSEVVREAMRLIRSPTRR
jgi:hypothetical protein